MILIGLVATVWIVISLLGLALCRAAGAADRQQQKTSAAGRSGRIADRLASLCARIAPSAEWIVARDRIRMSVIEMIDIDTKHLCQQELQILSVPLLVLLWAGVTHAEVKITVGSELDASAAVILGRAYDFEQPPRLAS